MKTLIESILGSNGAGVKSLIKKFAMESLGFSEDQFTINSKNEIEINNHKCKLCYTRPIIIKKEIQELPEYIQFADCPDFEFCILYEDTPKSFHGLPKLCKSFALRFKNNYRRYELPPLEMTVIDSFRLNNSDVIKYEKLDITFIGSSNSAGELYLKTKAPLENVSIKGAKVIDVVNDFNLGDDFSKAMIRKAVQNKYKNQFQIPVSPAGLRVINTFWKGIDVSNLEKINYTQNSQLLKHTDGRWYRFNNYDW